MKNIYKILFLLPLFLVTSCVDNLNIYVWADTRGGIRYTVSDATNNVSYLVDVEVSASGIKPKVAAIGTIIYIFYIEGTSIKFRKINPVSPSTLESAVTAVSDVDATNKNYDTQAIQDKILIS